MYAQHPEQHTLSMAQTKQTMMRFKAHFDIHQRQHQRSQVSWECGTEQRDVLIRFRWGECVYACVCVEGVDLAGQTDEGASKSGSCLIQEGEERAGAPPYEQHLPLLSSPSSIPST